MELVDLLMRTVEKKGSDLFLIPGAPATAKVGGALVAISEETLMPKDTERLVDEAYRLAGNRSRAPLDEGGDDDFSFSLARVSRFRCNAYRQRGSLAATCRVVAFGLPDPAALHIPDLVMALAGMRGGMILVTGPAGSGKSTTLACMIDRINHRREGHIITMEDPIEYIHRHGKSIVTQREIGSDSPSYLAALRSALRESPDIILLGEMRDRETIEVAMTAAETGQLLFSTLHTTGAASTVDRIVDVFPASQQNQVRIQLSMVLQAVISQQLVPTVDGGQTVAFEVMYSNTAIRTLIREAKSHQIDAAIQAGAAEGMCTMDASLLRLVQQQRITKETALTYSIHYEAMEKRLAALAAL